MTTQSLRWNIAQKAELTWWKRYLSSKQRESYISWKKEYWHSLLWKVRDTVDVSQARSILDMGCGPAGIFLILDGCNTTAVDPLLSAYREKLEHFDPDDHPSVSFVDASVESYRPGKPFDLIFCINAINHVHDIGQGFRQLTSMLCPGGKLVLTIDSHNYRIFKRLFRMVPLDVLHPHQHDLGEYEHMLAANQLHILQQVTVRSRFIFDHELIVAQKPAEEKAVSV